MVVDRRVTDVELRHATSFSQCSPNAEDHGGLIGRDPRKIPPGVGGQLALARRA
jgi:hypothetical protein